MFYFSFDILDKLQLEDTPFQFTELQAEVEMNGNVPALVAREWKYCRTTKEKAIELACLITLANATFRAGDEEKSKLFETEYCKLMKKAEETLPETDVLEIKKFFLD